MKKIIFIILFLAVNIDSVYSQSAFYDALTLRKQIDNVTGKFKTDSASEVIVGSILYSYCVKKTKAPHSTKYTTIKELFKTPESKEYNPFIQEYFPTVGSGQSNNLSSLASNLGSSIGGLDVTTIADGLAKFIVARTKEELNTAFFSKFQDLLSRPEYKDLQTVFPHTYSALNAIGNEIYNYNAYLGTLRDAFKSDLSSLTSHLPTIIENHPEFFDRYPSLAATLRSGCYIANGINDKTHPGDILKDYPLEYLDSLNPNWTASIKTLQLFSASLKDTATSPDSPYWVSLSKLKALLNDSIAFKIYMGLIYHQALAKNIKFQTTINGKIVTTPLTDILVNDVDNVTAYKNYIVKFVEKTNTLSRMIKTYQKVSGDSLTIEQYTSYFDASINLLEYASQASDLIPKKWANDLNHSNIKYLFHLKDTLKEYFNVAHSTSNLVLAINRKNYSSAVMNAVNIYDIIFASKAAKAFDRAYSNKEYKKAKKAIKDEKGGKQLLKNIKNNHLTDDQKNISVVKKNLPIIEDKLKGKDTTESKTILADILKYGTFMASIVQAQSSDEVQSAIEAFALPPGSSRIKRETPFNVSINAYSGLFAGYEQIQGLKSDRCIQVNTYGVTAPIGIAISTGQHRFLHLGSEKRKHWSYSAFVSIVDLGAITAFRFNNDTATTSQIPKIELKDILSPGLFFSIGIPKCPLSINLGTQMGPNLRSVSTTGNNYSNSVYWRYSISFVVDIPVLNLYTKSAN